MRPAQLTISQAQEHQPWVVPYSEGVQNAACVDVPHILASHAVLHAAKSVGKLAAVFERLDHTGGAPTIEQHRDIVAMSADLFTIALRLANLYDFDLATALCERVQEKNGVSLLSAIEPIAGRPATT